MTAAAHRANIAKIHIAKKQLGLDDDLYRETLQQLTGKTSSALMSPQEQKKVLEHFSNAGFKASSKTGLKRVTGPAAKLVTKIEALWLSGWNLGVITDPSHKAMEAFIARQTGLARAQWLQQAGDANKVIEALKSWLSREAAIDWSQPRDDAAACVLHAQWKMLAQLHATPDIWIFSDALTDQKRLGKLIRQAKARADIRLTS